MAVSDAITACRCNKLNENKWRKKLDDDNKRRRAKK